MAMGVKEIGLLSACGGRVSRNTQLPSGFCVPTRFAAATSVTAFGATPALASVMAISGSAWLWHEIHLDWAGLRGSSCAMAAATAAGTSRGDCDAAGGGGGCRVGAPAFRSMRAAAVSPCSKAQSRAVRPASSRASRSAPCSMSSSTMAGSGCGAAAAIISGVTPCEPVASSSAPCSMSSRAVAYLRDIPRRPHQGRGAAAG